MTDQVQLAVSKQDLLDNSRLENRQAFSSPPTLGILKHLLEVICEQLKKYELWPVRSTGIYLALACANTQMCALRPNSKTAGSSCR